MCAPAAVLAADVTVLPEVVYAPDFSIALPAVSAPNGKIAAFGGVVDEKTVYGGYGAVSIPLGERFGAQIDGMVGSGDGSLFYGVGGHLFWRDPTKGLVGLYGSYVGWDASDSAPIPDGESPLGGVIDTTGANVAKVGVEGQAYFGRVSLEGLATYQFATDSGFAGRATVALYPIDDLRLAVSASYLQGVGAIGSAGVEWAPGLSGLSLFANGAYDEGGDWQAIGGIKFYFAGEQKSLIRRHREDDPQIYLPDDLYLTVGGAHCPPDKPVLDPDGLICRTLK